MVLDCADHSNQNVMMMECACEGNFGLDSSGGGEGDDKSGRRDWGVRIPHSVSVFNS